MYRLFFITIQVLTTIKMSVYMPETTDIMPSQIYKCGFCNKGYKLKPNYVKHYIVCELLYKTKNEKINEEREKPPTIKELYCIILDMASKYEKLEKKVEELTKISDSKKKKLDVICWLNDKFVDIQSFTDWLNTIKITRDHLENVFKNDYINSIVQIIYEFIKNKNGENIPIKAFDQKENTIFMYSRTNNGGGGWCIMSQQSFSELFNWVNKQLLTEFVTWQKENKHHMYEDEFSSIYTANVKKIIGLNMSQEQIQNKVKRDLYKAIKMNLQNIVEFEFSF
jgi:hypothetical protein